MNDNLSFSEKFDILFLDAQKKYKYSVLDFLLDFRLKTGYNLSQTHFYKLRKGEIASPGLALLEALSLYFNVTLDYFSNRDHDRLEELLHEMKISKRSLGNSKSGKDEIDAILAILDDIRSAEE